MQLSGQISGLHTGHSGGHPGDRADRAALSEVLRAFARRRVHEWAERSQQAACRNAMVASTLLTEQAHERREVERYLADTLRPETSTAPAPTGSALG